MMLEKRMKECEANDGEDDSDDDGSRKSNGTKKKGPKDNLHF